MSLNFWKTQVIAILRLPSIEKTLLKEFSRHSPHKECSIVLDALKNYFSSNNPGFEHNWFQFDNGVTFVISREGMFFKPPENPSNQVLEDIEYSQWILAEKITKPVWLRTFMGKFPDIEDEDSSEEEE